MFDGGGKKRSRNWRTGGRVNYVNAIDHARIRWGGAVRVDVTDQFLSNADGLKVHPEDRRGADVLGAGVVETGDLVENGGDFRVVVIFCASQARGIHDVGRAGAFRRIGVDLRREEIIDAMPGRAVDDVVGGMFVAPRCAEVRFVGDFEDRVHPKKSVRINRQEGVRFAWEPLRIDPSAGIGTSQIEVDRFIVYGLGAGSIAAERVAVGVHKGRE